jgi:outer membrane protein
MRKAAGWVLGASLALGTAGAQTTLTLGDYLAQVKARGPAYRSAVASAKGYDKQSHQQDLTYSPVLTAGYNHLDDQSEQSSILSADRTQVDSMGVTLSTLMPFGPTLKLGYALEDITIGYPQALLDSFGPLASDFLTSYYQVSPMVSLSLPLFKDFGGAQTNAGVKSVQYQMESQSRQAAFQGAQDLYNAKIAYWNLALARVAAVIRLATLERSRKIWEWTKRRVARNLADPPDALQAEASVRLAELDLEQAVENERSARLQFNRCRGRVDGAVPEVLEGLESSLASLKVDLPENPPARLDLQAARKAADSQKAVYDQAAQNVYPDITVNASWQGNGLDPAFPHANEAAFGPDHPTWNIGAQFNLPLDVFTASRAAEGYKLDYESSLLGYEDKKLQVEQDWSDWKNRLSDADKRLAMTAQIEDIQRRKADQEKKRLEYGRTTEFQLLSFENDYSAARLNRLSVVLEKLSLLAEAQWWLSTAKE